jgi:hypothetical protein
MCTCAHSNMHACSQPLQCGWFCLVALLRRMHSGWFCLVALLRCLHKHSTASLPALHCIECGQAALAAHTKIDLSVRLHWTRYISAPHKAHASLQCTHACAPARVRCPLSHIHMHPHARTASFRAALCVYHFRRGAAHELSGSQGRWSQEQVQAGGHGLGWHVHEGRRPSAMVAGGYRLCHKCMHACAHALPRDTAPQLNAQAWKRALTLTLYNALRAQRNVSRPLSLCAMQCGPNGMCRAHSQFGQRNVRVVQL